jgi:hypothetical protein
MKIEVLFGPKSLTTQACKILDSEHFVLFYRVSFNFCKADYQSLTGIKEADTFTVVPQAPVYIAKC